MAFFPFIESFFFLSLGITFILIFLMVFHFKQRVEQLEKKHDDIAELCNSLINQVQMLTGVINVKHSKPVGFFPETNSKLTENITFSTSSPIPLDVPSTLPFPSVVPWEYKKIVVDDSILEEEELEWEEEEDDDVDVDVEDLEFERELENDIEENERNLEEVEMEVDVSLDLEDNEKKVEPIVENLLPLEETEITVSSEVECSIPTPENENVVVIESNIFLEPEQEETNNENYQKMNVKQLKQIVQAKGLSSDANKLKRDELLRLLV